MKKALSLIIALGLLSTVLAGCNSGSEGARQASAQKAAESSAGTGDVPAYLNPTGYPIAKDKITMKMMGAKSAASGEWEKMDFFIKAEQRTNIAFTFDTPPAQSYEEKKNIAFASGEIPDLFFGGNLSLNDEMRYGSQGILLPLEKLADKYAPNLTKLLSSNPEYRKFITTMDGHIYALPNINELPRDLMPAIWINGVWLKDVNLQMPKTTDEFYTVLKAFKEKDPNKNGKPDEIPMSSIKLKDVKPLLITAYGLLDNIFTENEKVTFSPIDNRYKEYLKYTKKLFSEELIDKEIFSQTTQQITAKGNNDQLGVFRNAAPYLYVRVEKNGDYQAVPPLTSAVNGKQLWPKSSGLFRGTFAVTKNNKYAEAAIRWVDQYYTAEGGHNAIFGSEGLGWEWIDAQKSKFRRLSPQGVNPEEFRAKITPAAGSVPPLYRSRELTSKRDDVNVNHADREVEKNNAPHAVVPFPLVYYNDAEQKRMAVLETDINTYVEQMEAKFILGTESLERWDEYVATLKKMGVDELIKIYQTAYDRWKNIK